MRLATFVAVLAMLAALDLMVAVSASLYAERGAAVLVVLFFAVAVLAVWRR